MDLHTITRVDRPDHDLAVRSCAGTVAGDGGATALLGGGTWLFSVPQPHLHGLVDLTAAAWAPLTVAKEGLSIAATATLGELAALETPADWAAAPLLRGCCEALVGSAKVQRVATVGGNIALALPAGPMITLAAALDGDAVVWPAEGGEQRLPVADLVLGSRRTSLRAGDVLRSVELPAYALRARTALRKASLSTLGRSAALVAGRVDAAGDGPQPGRSNGSGDSRDGEGAFVLAVTASLERPAVLRFPSIPSADELAEAVDALGPWFDDPHGAPDWRRAMTLRLAEEIRTELEEGA